MESIGYLVMSCFDRVLGDELLEVGDLLLGGQLLAVRILLLAVLELLVVIVEGVTLLEAELGSGAVHGDLHVLAGLVTGLLDGLHDAVEGIVDTFKLRGETTFVADRGGKAAGLEDFLQGVEDLRADADRLGLVRSADGTDHELLERDGGVGVGAAVDDVHHRDREDIGIGAAEIAVQGDLELSRSRFRDGEGDAEDGVGAEFGLGRGAVEFDHLRVDGALLEGVHADDFRGDNLVDVLDGLQDALAAVTAAAVAEFKRLVLTGGSTGRNGGDADKTGIKGHFDLDGRVASGVEDFPAENLYDLHNCYRVKTFAFKSVANLAISPHMRKYLPGRGKGYRTRTTLMPGQFFFATAYSAMVLGSTMTFPPLEEAWMKPARPSST